MSNRTVIVGLDGMPFGLIEKLGRDGTMPNLGRLADRGVLRPMASSIPEISSVAWSTLITGANPGEHGIFGFMDLAPNTYRMTFPNFASNHAEAFWQRNREGQSVILNVPATYPAAAIDGALVAGFVAPNLSKATQPKSLVPYLEDIGYRVDVDYSRAAESIPYFLSDLNRTLDARITAYRHLWETVDWNTFMLVFTGVDRMAHFLWHAYEDPTHEHHGAFLDHLRQIDDVIGEIADRVGDETPILMLSDHGFERLEKDVFVNHLLLERGFFEFNDPDGSSRKFGDIGAGTTAFALDPGRIYVHLEGKYPRGSVSPADREAVVRDVKALLEDVEVEGRGVVRRVYRKEEVFEGSLLDRAPDLVPVAAEGFNLRPTLGTGQLWNPSERTGKHSQHDAFLLATGPRAEEVVPPTPGVSDFVGILDGIRDQA